MRKAAVSIAIGVALCGLAFALPHVRRTVIHAFTTYDAEPSAPVALPAASGAGLTKTPRVRVVLIDGLGAETAATMPTWRVLCNSGALLDIDVGFPTVSLPVEIALWTGLTQQQTGVVANRAFAQPISGLPSKMPGSVAVAENHGYIVRALGFSRTEPEAEPDKPMKDRNEVAWDQQWLTLAVEAVKSPAALVFVHILRVDNAGHKFGLGAEYDKAAKEADGILDHLVQTDPGARWFLLSDHGHIEGGGHGGEERSIRHVTGCITGEGIKPAQKSGLIHIVDVSRALADSLGVAPDPASVGRPFEAAMATNLGADQSVPALPLSTAAVAIAILLAGFAIAVWGVRRWWLAPWWFALACVLLIVIRGLPSLSTPMIYKPEGRDMWIAWAPALLAAVAATWFGVVRGVSLARVLAGQLAVPVAALAAVITAAGAWSAVFGAEVAPVTPHFTAWMSAVMLMVAQACAAVGFAVLASVARRAFGRRAPPGPPRSEPAGA